jgi:hypothetical protein
LAITAQDADKAEGNSGTTPFTFTVTRVGDTSGAASVQYTVAGSGANPADANDFDGNQLPSGTVQFAPGETSQTITILVVGDTVVEPDETFTVTLSNPSGATIDTATATGRIINDDSATLSINDVTRAEGNSGTTEFQFTVTLSHQSASPVSVTVNTVTGRRWSPTTITSRS